MVEGLQTTDNDILETQVSCRHLIDISPDAVMICHNDKIVLANDECLKLLGAKDRSQIVGLSHAEIVPSEQLTAMKDQLRDVVQKGLSAPLMVTTVRRLDGEIIPVERQFVAMPRHDGSMAVLIALRDLSERTRVAGRMMHSETLVRSILDSAMDGIISIDANQNIILFNSAAEAIFGWRADQVLGCKIDMLIPSRFRSSHREQVEQFNYSASKGRRMGSQRTVMALRASGEEFPIEASISKTTSNNKTVYSVILRDVSESVRHRRQIEFQSQILDQISDAVSVLDLEGRITYWNGAAHRLFGWESQEALGRKAFELLYRGDADTLSLVQHESAAGRSWAGELTVTTRTGETIVVEHRRTVLRDSSAALMGFLCIDINITDRKKRERQAHRSQRLESIGTLAGGIAHDLNNVLTPLLMGAKLLSIGRVTSNHQGLLDTMVASAQRGADLIRQLLSFAGGIQGERSHVNLNTLITETRGLLEHTLPKSIRIHTEVDSDCPMVMGDATELLQVLMNLCINARDAMPEGGTLGIEATSIRLNGNSTTMHPDATPGLYALIKVTDTGTGMSPEVLDRIFDPFFTTKELGKGTGLGLATSQGIVKSHGGFFVVYSEPGNGSKFSIYLPATHDSIPEANHPTQPTDSSGAGELVLVVDDEAFVLQMTSATLESAGYRVLAAQDCNAALAIFKEHRTEIVAVVLDIMMPTSDGFQTLDELRKIDPDVIVIACSGLGTRQRETDILQRGAAAFLAKPYSDEQLLKLLVDLRTRTGSRSRTNVK